ANPRPGAWCASRSTGRSGRPFLPTELSMKFTATARSAQGSSASRRLRRAGRVPAIVYGGADAPLSIELDHNEIFHALRKEEFHASILDMQLDGKGQQVL